MYGSNFCMRTRRPRRSNNMPIEALVSPLPSELTTPPVTKMCFVMEENHTRRRPNHEGANWPSTGLWFSRFRILASPIPQIRAHE